MWCSLCVSVLGDEISELPFDTGVGDDPLVNNDYVLVVRNGSDTVVCRRRAVYSVQYVAVHDHQSDSTLRHRPIQWYFKHLVGQSVLHGQAATDADETAVAIFGTYLIPKAMGNAKLTLGTVDKSMIKVPLEYPALFGGACGQ